MTKEGTVSKNVDIPEEDIKFLKENSIKLSPLVRDLVHDFITNKVSSYGEHPEEKKESVDTFQFIKNVIREVIRLQYYQFKDNDCDLTFAQWNRLHIALRENHIFLSDDMIKQMLKRDELWM